MPCSTTVRANPSPEVAERLVVLVALTGMVPRATASHLLWPLAATRRAAGNLRSALWRLRTAAPEVVAEHDGILEVSAGLGVDVRLLVDRAASLAAGHDRHDDLTLVPSSRRRSTCSPGTTTGSPASAKHSGPSRSTRSTRCRHGCAWTVSAQSAIDLALLAVTADPLRETSQVALVNAHLAEGNVCEARRAHASYRETLAEVVSL